MNPEARAYHTATRQGGVLTRQQLLTIGLTDRLIEHRISSGQWDRLTRGTYLLLPLMDRLDRVRAAAAVLPDGVVSHFSAAEIHGIERLPPSPPTLLVHTQTTHVFPGVNVIRCHDLDESHVETISGLRVTTVARTVVDLASQLTEGQLGVCVDGALAARMTDIESIQSVLDAVARKGKPGVRSMRAVLAERAGNDHSRSILEQRGLRILEEDMFDGFKLEYPIPWSPRQRFDVAFPKARIAIEWDSRRWHTHVDAFQSDRERDRTAAAHGWRILRFTWADVHDRPTVVTATLHKALASG